MDPVFFALVLIPIAIPLVGKFLLRLDISWLEWALIAVICVAMLAGLWYGTKLSAANDREVWNGAIVSKDVDRERCYTNMLPRVCSQSYSCNCHQVCSTSTDSKGNRTESCHQECDTCYRYSWEQDWNARSTLNAYTISRVDAQGAREPSRWTRIKTGDPVAATRPYQNWVAASANTVFRDSKAQAERFEAILPDYPIGVFDYYRIDRVVTPNLRIANEAQWNSELSKMLSVVGPRRQMNMIVVFVNAPQEFATGLRYHWKGFKKNDAVMVVGVQGGLVTWSQTMSWSKNASFDIEMRNLISAYRGQPVANLNPAVVMPQIGQIASRSFVRRSMEEFEYLKSDIPPPKWLIWTEIILGLLLSGIATYVFHRVDLDDALFNRSASRRYY